MKPKEFPDITSQTVPKGGLTDLLLGHDPQAMSGIFIFLHKNNKISGSPSPPFFHDSPEVLRSCDPLLFCKAIRAFHCLDERVYWRFSGLRRTKRLIFFFPSVAFALKHFGRSLYSSSPKNHESACVLNCWAGKSVSLNPLLKSGLFFEIIELLV